jgi:2-C-methyl-D-erythritol 4-phosphate cytidylyltransferase
MGAGRNKALLELAGRPLLLHSVETFGLLCDRLVVVAPEAELPEVRALAPSADVVAGGPTRHGSEWNALRFLERTAAAEDVIAIHDAARPLVAAADVRAVFDAAGRHGAAMLAQRSAQAALEIVEGRVVRVYPAEAVWRAQTPQAARADWLFDAYRRAAAEGFDGTDTAAVLARAGRRVSVVAATAPNPKVTVPDDLPLAESLLAQRPGTEDAPTAG